MESKKREYGVETSKNLDVVVLGEVLGSALGEDTMGRLDDGGISIEDYEAVKIWTENRHMRHQSRAAGKSLPKDSDKMVYGVDAALPPTAAPPARAQVDAEVAQCIRPAQPRLPASQTRG